MLLCFQFSCPGFADKVTCPKIHEGQDRGGTVSENLALPLIRFNSIHPWLMADFECYSAMVESRSTSVVAST